MHQIDLILPPRAFARRTDPSQSHRAASSIEPASISGLILASLRTDGPATSHELAERLGLSLVTVSPRIAPLRRRCLLEAHGLDANNRMRWKLA